MNKQEQTSIFIVEDNKLFTLALKADIEVAFAQRNIQIFSFETGEECMEKFKEVKPEVVILDYHLNSLNLDAANGLKVLDWIKKENNETNIIMLTSDDNIDIATNAFKHGACDYVVKTSTKFKKINYSLFNLFKMMEAKKEARGYKQLLMAASIGIALIVIGIAVIYAVSPSLLD